MTNRQRRCKAIINDVKCREKFTPKFNAEWWCCDEHRDVIVQETLAKVRVKNERDKKKAEKEAKKAYNQKTKEMRARITPKKRKTGGVLREPIDILFSYLVRERANWICECCGTDYSDNKQMFDCSHFKKRNIKATRYHPYNAMAHCRSCHQKLGKDSEGMTAEYVKCFSEAQKDIVTALSNKTCKLLKHHTKEIVEHYKKEEARLKQLRANGYDGYIEFTCPEWYQIGDYSG